MIRYILDTDHITLYQRGHPLIRTRIAAIPVEQLAVTIISFEEQVRGRLAQVRRAQGEAATVLAYKLLQETFTYFSHSSVLPFDPIAVDAFYRLRRQGIRVGPDDLSIAAIALVHNCTVVTRNRRDFERVPGLAVEDWSIIPEGL